MRIGRLRHAITIEQPTDSAPSDRGTITKTWATYIAGWGLIEPINAREIEHAKRFAVTVDHKVTIRYRAGVKASMRIKFGTRILNINGITNTEERNKELVLYCTEVGQ